jgi:O-antigen ligase
VNALHTPQWEPAWNPHNQYLLVLTAAGIPGALALGLVLLFPLARRGADDGRDRIRRAPPLLLIVICLFESYLARSNVSMMYLLFMAAACCGLPRGPAAPPIPAGR